MEKTVDIGGKEVFLKSSAMTPVIYRDAFGRDIFKAQSSIFALANKNIETAQNVDSVGIMEITWAMARTADENTPEFLVWLDTLEAFPIFDVLKDIVELVMQNMTTTSRIKNVKAAGN